MMSFGASFTSQFAIEAVELMYSSALCSLTIGALFSIHLK